MCDQWADQFDAKRAAGQPTLDTGMCDEGTGLFRSLPSTADREVVLCPNLYAGSILAAQREPWLVVDQSLPRRPDRRRDPTPRPVAAG
ncbi:MAG: hypothetical protein ACYDAQ_00415 [Mycobacteriales bacterium]